MGGSIFGVFGSGAMGEDRKHRSWRNEMESISGGWGLVVVLVGLDWRYKDRSVAVVVVVEKQHSGSSGLEPRKAAGHF